MELDSTLVNHDLDIKMESKSNHPKFTKNTDEAKEPILTKQKTKKNTQLDPYFGTKSNIDKDGYVCLTHSFVLNPVGF